MALVNGAFCTIQTLRNSKENLHLRNRWSDFEIFSQESGFDISRGPHCLIRAVIATGKLPSPYVSTLGKKNFQSVIVISDLYHRYR